MYRFVLYYSAIIVCPWGDDGAAASDKNGKVISEFTVHHIFKD